MPVCAVYSQVINLVGPISQQDVEIAALYKDATLTYGEGKVLGILAHQSEHRHGIHKREAEEKPSSTTESPDASDEKPQRNCIYQDSGLIRAAMKKWTISHSSMKPILCISI